MYQTLVNNTTVYLNVPDGSRMPTWERSETTLCFDARTRKLCIRAYKCTRDIQSARKGDTLNIPRSCLRSLTSNFTHCTLANGKMGAAAGRGGGGRFRKGQHGRRHEVRRESAWKTRYSRILVLQAHQRSNNSLDAPSRSSVTRTVRAFYSARGHSW